MFERAFSGAPWEAKAGYCRAIRAGSHIYVTGTVPIDPDGGVHAPGDGEAQAARCLEIIEEALRKLGADRRAIVRTRMFVTDIDRWEEFGRAHRAFFADNPPATTMVQVARLIDRAMLIEIEADAVAPPAGAEAHGTGAEQAATSGAQAPAGAAQGGKAGGAAQGGQAGGAAQGGQAGGAAQGGQAGGAALDPSDPLGALNQAFLDAYAARREAVLASIEPIIAQIDDSLILRRGGRRLEGPARTRRYHELKVVAHVPLAVHALLSGRRGALDGGARARLDALRHRIIAAAEGLERRGFTPEQLARQRRILDASIALLDEALAAGDVAPEALSAFTRAQTRDVLLNAEDAARDQIETMHATVEAWKQQMTAEERDRLRAVVAVSHMARPGNVAAQYFSVTLGETWQGRFDQENLRPGKRVLTAEATFDEAEAFALLATHALDAGVATRFFGEETRLARDILADAAERILAGMFHKEPEPPAQPVET
ncbi:RidA family protein [Sorangium sp. So ce1389]|uniref:RidA family protein n=1 Tax=Sorangium sp. So ce1389 TaxID=3133336 RepID=UPI003F5FD8B6